MPVNECNRDSSLERGSIAYREEAVRSAAQRTARLADETAWRVPVWLEWLFWLLVLLAASAAALLLAYPDAAAILGIGVPGSEPANGDRMPGGNEP